ncbi:hypothetical protein BSG1_10063 [Bacillus sp. SG-1]|nr:hypothetical protein BSG1_10063 [Bacillus sp. SG-1]
MLISVLLLSACGDKSEVDNVPAIYEFKEPNDFPFEITEVSTEIDLEVPNHLHQFIFYYSNEDTSQQLKYIVSKVLEEPEDNKATKDLGTEYTLENGLPAYYDERPGKQSLWWENADGFLARYVYFANDNTSEFGDNKLEVEDLLDLANQVQ